MQQLPHPPGATDIDSLRGRPETPQHHQAEDHPHEHPGPLEQQCRRIRQRHHDGIDELQIDRGNQPARRFPQQRRDPGIPIETVRDHRPPHQIDRQSHRTGRGRGQAHQPIRAASGPHIEQLPGGHQQNEHRQHRQQRSELRVHRTVPVHPVQQRPRAVLLGDTDQHTRRGRQHQHPMAPHRQPPRRPPAPPQPLGADEAAARASDSSPTVRSRTTAPPAGPRGTARTTPDPHTPRPAPADCRAPDRTTPVTPTTGRSPAGRTPRTSGRAHWPRPPVQPGCAVPGWCPRAPAPARGAPPASAPPAVRPPRHPTGPHPADARRTAPR